MSSISSPSKVNAIGNPESAIKNIAMITTPTGRAVVSAGLMAAKHTPPLTLVIGPTRNAIG